MDDKESRVPLALSASTPQVQYFDVSDADSTDTEPEGPSAQAAADSDDGELEVFVADDAPAPRPRALSRPPAKDPFGLKETPASAAAPSPLPQALPQYSFFDGQGLPGGTAKAEGLNDQGYDDEFDYVFEGKAREGETHKRVFEASSIPVPKGLLTNVQDSKLGSFLEEEEVEEEGEKEEGEPTEELSLMRPPSTGVEADEEPPDPWMAANAAIENRTASGAPAITTSPTQRIRPPVELPQEALPPALAASDPPHAAEERSDVLPEPSLPTIGSQALDLDEIDLLGGSMEPSVQKEASTKTHSFEVPTELGAKDDVWDAANRQLEQPSGSQGNQSKVQAFPAMMLSPCPREPSDSEALLRAINSSKGRSALSSESAFEYFSGADIGPHLNEIVEDDGSNRGVWGRIISILTCSSSIRNPVLLNERRRIFCYAKIPFDNEDDVHFRILSSIYERYTARPPPARYGSHWEDVGFQGKDPATDLRGCGMLGLLQLLHLWDAGPSNARAIYRLSRDADQEFPLAVVAMNVTKWSLQVLRSGELNAAANKSQKLIQEFNKFYVGVFYFFYGHWVEKQATMRDSGHVMKAVETHCKCNVSKMLLLATASNLQPI